MKSKAQELIDSVIERGQGRADPLYMSKKRKKKTSLVDKDKSDK